MSVSHFPALICAGKILRLPRLENCLATCKSFGSGVEALSRLVPEAFTPILEGATQQQLKFVSWAKQRMSYFVEAYDELSTGGCEQLLHFVAANGGDQVLLKWSDLALYCLRSRISAAVGFFRSWRASGMSRRL